VGTPPVVARHSGLAEVATGLEAEYPPDLRDLASFTSGDAKELAAKLERLLSLPAPSRTELSAAARRAAVKNWSWRSVANRLLEPLQIR
jgi:glycosyltransferase involved in cell wall biosynthesis